MSKSQYVTGLQCPKALWLYRYRKDLMPPTPPGLQQIFDQGHVVGELAWKRFPGGTLIAEDHLQTEQAIKSTTKAVAAGANVLYEAGAISDGVLVRSDIIQKNKDGSWDLIEVKSSSGVKDVYLHDLAIQRYVLEGAGFRIRKTILMHVNTSYVRRGVIDPMGFFTLADVTAVVKTMLKAVPKEVARLHVVTALKCTGHRNWSSMRCADVEHEIDKRLDTWKRMGPRPKVHHGLVGEPTRRGFWPRNLRWS